MVPASPPRSRSGTDGRRSRMHADPGVGVRPTGRGKQRPAALIPPPPRSRAVLLRGRQPAATDAPARATTRWRPAPARCRARRRPAASPAGRWPSPARRPTSDPSGADGDGEEAHRGGHPAEQPIGRDRLAQRQVVDAVEHRAEVEHAASPRPSTQRGRPRAAADQPEHLPRQRRQASGRARSPGRRRSAPTAARPIAAASTQPSAAAM